MMSKFFPKEIAARSCSIKTENTHLFWSLFFKKVAGWRSVNFIEKKFNFTKKETLTQVFSFELHEIFKNSYFVENLEMASSGSSLFHEEQRWLSGGVLWIDALRKFKGNTCARASFSIKLQVTCNFIKNKALAQVFSFHFGKVLRALLFKEYFWRLCLKKRPSE